MPRDDITADSGYYRCGIKDELLFSDDAANEITKKTSLLPTLLPFYFIATSTLNDSNPFKGLTFTFLNPAFVHRSFH